jgi:AcrR family transcriptional regulator
VTSTPTISTRDRLVTATNELFRRGGYHGTSLKEVTRAARAPTGSLYHFFPGGKAELASAVVLESGAAYQQLFEVIADDASDPADACTAFFDGAAATLEETDFVDICPIGTVAREVASTDEGLRIACAEVFARWVEAAASRFRAAGVDAEPAIELAQTLIATLEGAFVLARAARDATPVRVAGRQLRALVEARLLEVGAGRSGASLT